MLDICITAPITPPKHQSFGPTFVLDVNLCSSARSLVLWGPSGCGKTALLQTIVGIRRPHSGHIYLDGQPLFDRQRQLDIPTHQRQIGYVFQQGALFPHLNVFNNIAFGLPRGTAHRDRQVRDLARCCQVEDLLERRVTHLSGGQAQRVAIARALAIRPRLLLLDEPFNALDPELRATLRTVVLDRCRALGIPFVLVTHDRAEAELMGDAIATMRDGRVVEMADCAPDSKRASLNVSSSLH